MIILTNCLTEIADEGCLKVANSLVKRIKAAEPGVTVVSYERRSESTDRYLELNKFLLNKSLFRLLRRQREPVLYIPFPAKPFSTAVRVFVLSLGCRKGLRVLITMNVPMGIFAKVLYKLSGAKFLVLSEESETLYRNALGSGRVTRVQTGVDTKRFCPTVPEQAEKLKEKYGFDREKPLVLHVGHLTRGRNVEQLMKISDRFQKLLVTSTLTKNEQDLSLREELERAGITVMDTYIPDIQEIYQMADVYFFPVLESGHCIDVPLSCLEAAACDKPVVTTYYGEMKALEGASGFYFLDSLEPEYINAALEKAVSENQLNTRQAVLRYDWNTAVAILLDEA